MEPVAQQPLMQQSNSWLNFDFFFLNWCVSLFNVSLVALRFLFRSLHMVRVSSYRRKCGQLSQ